MPGSEEFREIYDGPTDTVLNVCTVPGVPRLRRPVFTRVKLIEQDSNVDVAVIRWMTALKDPTGAKLDYKDGEFEYNQTILSGMDYHPVADLQRIMRKPVNGTRTRVTRTISKTMKRGLNNDKKPLECSKRQTEELC